MENADLHILVAEDDSNDALILVRALHKHFPGSSVHVVNDGSEAVEYLIGGGAYQDRKSFPWPHALITDLKMPRISGLELLDWLSQHPEYRPAPCVMFSSSDDAEDISRAYKLGVAGYLTKSTSPDTFEKLADLLRDSWTQKPRTAVEAVAKPATAVPENNEPAPETPVRVQPMPDGVRIEVGETDEHALGCEVRFPSGMAFRMDGRDITPSFKFRHESRLDIYEAEIGEQERLCVRIERQHCAPRRSKLRVLANGRLLQVSHVCGRRTGRDSVFQFLMPGTLLVLMAYYSFAYKPEVADFYCEKFLGPRDVPAKYEKAPGRHRAVPTGAQKQKALVSCNWQPSNA
jgi:CheY-like chemotaxis protein